jgi:hypothetical protein
MAQQNLKVPRPKGLGFNPKILMKHKAVQQLGRLGGKVTSEAKAVAVRENGKKGGRPPKSATAMLIRNAEGGWSFCRWKGDIIPSEGFATQAQAREFAVSKNWGVKRLPECDGGQWKATKEIRLKFPSLKGGVSTQKL